MADEKPSILGADTTPAEPAVQPQVVSEAGNPALAEPAVQPTGQVPVEQGEGAKPTPEVYSDLAVPEGMEVDKSFLDKAKPILAELGLPKEAAQKLVDLYASHIQESVQEREESFSRLMDQWESEVKNDPELGGANLEKTVGLAKAAIDKYGSPEVLSLLNETGLGSNPKILQFLKTVGMSVQEDSPTSRGSAAGAKLSRAQVLYPETK